MAIFSNNNIIDINPNILSENTNFKILFIITINSIKQLTYIIPIITTYIILRTIYLYYTIKNKETTYILKTKNLSPENSIIQNIIIILEYKAIIILDYKLKKKKIPIKIILKNILFPIPKLWINSLYLIYTYIKYKDYNINYIMYQELILSFEKDIQHNMHTIITGMKLPDNVKDMLSKKTLEIIKITSYKSISPRGILTNHPEFYIYKNDHTSMIESKNPITITGKNSMNNGYGHDIIITNNFRANIVRDKIAEAYTTQKFMTKHNLTNNEQLQNYLNQSFKAALELDKQKLLVDVVIYDPITKTQKIEKIENLNHDATIYMYAFLNKIPQDQVDIYLTHQNKNNEWQQITPKQKIQSFKNSIDLLDDNI